MIGNRARPLTHVEHLADAVGRLLFVDHMGAVQGVVITPARAVFDVERGGEAIRITVELLGAADDG